MLCSAGEADTDCLVLLDENLLDARVVLDLAAEVEIPLLDQSGERKGTADRIPGSTIVHPGEGHHHRDHREIREVEGEREGLAEERIVEVLSELTDGRPGPTAEDTHVRKESQRHGELPDRADQLSWALDRQVHPGQLPDAAGPLAKNVAIPRSELDQVSGQPVDVGVERERLSGFPLDSDEDIVVVDPLVRNRSDLRPKPVEAVCRR